MSSSANLKAVVSPFDFYRYELPSMPTPRRESGWTCGGLCCFHEDRHAGNFRIHLDSGAYGCFACGVSGGDIFHFAQARYGLDFREALEYIEEQYG